MKKNNPIIFSTYSDQNKMTLEFEKELGETIVKFNFKPRKTYVHLVKDF
jgi:hypothetical protein